MGTYEQMTPLSEQAWAVWHEARGLAPDVVVAPALPILYFGDLKAYRSSFLRVVTVGLNPSREEFPVEDRFRRFPRVRDLALLDRVGLTEALNDYFLADPYRSWFSTFEHLLNGMNASYYPGQESTALHTDLCSPVATDPTWTGLTDDIRLRLIDSGRPLWHELVKVLQPHVILISVAKRHIAKIGFPAAEAPWELHRLEGSRARPYVVEAGGCGSTRRHNP